MQITDLCDSWTHESGSPMGTAQRRVGVRILFVCVQGRTVRTDMYERAYVQLAAASISLNRYSPQCRSPLVSAVPLPGFMLPRRQDASKRGREGCVSSVRHPRLPCTPCGSATAGPAGRGQPGAVRPDPACLACRVSKRQDARTCRDDIGGPDEQTPRRRPTCFGPALRVFGIHLRRHPVRSGA